MKKLFVLVVLFSFASSLSFGQDSEKEKRFSIQTKLTNQLLWRSRPTTSAPTIVPSVDYTTHVFTTGIWAAYAIDNSYKEIDIYIGYQWKWLELWVFDYYNPAIVNNAGIDNFKLGETEHAFEGDLIVQPIASIPLKIRAALMFAGNDFKTEITPTGIEYKQRYSSYLGFTYDYKIGSIVITPELGLTPAKSMYADKFKVFNYSLNVSKAIKVNEHFSIPTTYTVAYNATLNKVFFSASIILR